MFFKGQREEDIEEEREGENIHFFNQVRLIIIV